MRQLMPLLKLLCHLLQLFPLQITQQRCFRSCLQHLHLPILELTVLAILLQEHLLVVVQLAFVHLTHVCQQIGKGTRQVRLRPCPRLQQHIEDGLLLYQILNALPGKTFRNTSRFCIVNTMGRTDPIFLNRPPMLHSNRTNHLSGSLKGLFKQCSHIEILGQQEDMGHKILSRCLGRERSGEFLILEENDSKNIPKFMYTQRFAKYHLKQCFRHTSKHNLMPCHQSRVQKLVHQRKLTTFSSQHMSTDGVDEERSESLVVLLRVVLHEGVGIGVQTVFVGSLGGQRVAQHHVHGKQVYHRLFPCDGFVRVNQFDSVQSVVFHLAQGTFV